MTRFMTRTFGAALAFLFATSLLGAQTTGKPVTAAGKAAAAKADDKKAPAPKDLTDINSATLAQLMELPGISDDLAKKIIAGRPYKSKSQLTSKKVLTADAYKKISDRIIAKQK